MKKRIGIFSFSDNNGIADKYIEYLLSDIRPCLSELIIVVNGTADNNAADLFKKTADKVIIRKDTGYDAAAYKKGIISCGEKLKEFDSLVLFNDSFFGPFYPFDGIFSEMESRGKDFWGISAEADTVGTGLCPYGFCPKHIETYFIVFEKAVLQSDDFIDFWNKLPIFRTRRETDEKFSAVISKKFSELGFCWDVLCDLSDLESSDRSRNFSQSVFNIFELVSERRFPVLLRQSFSSAKSEHLCFSNADELPRAIEYIEKNYCYDISMIFRHILRLYDPYRVKCSLNMDYVLNKSSSPPEPGEAVLIAHLVYDDMFEKYLRFLQNVPYNIDIIVTTNSTEKKERLSVLLQRLPNLKEIRIAENRGRDMAALLVCCRDVLLKYRYLCFIHDKKSAQKEFFTVGREFDRMLWENLLYDPEYINSVIGLFKEHSYLGILAPFGVNHGSYFHTSVDYWTVCYDETCRLAERLKMRMPSRTGQPFIVGTSFWCRTEAMKILFDNSFSYEDFPKEPAAGDGTFSHAIERILPYVAAQSGYASGWIYNADYARTMLSGLRYMSDSTVKVMSSYSAVRFSSFRYFLTSLERLSGKLRTTSLSMEERAADLTFKSRVKQRIKEMTPSSVRNFYRQIKNKRQ